jgi:hypothetical protein
MNEIKKLVVRRICTCVEWTRKSNFDEERNKKTIHSEIIVEYTNFMGTINIKRLTDIKNGRIKIIRQYIIRLYKIQGLQQINKINSNVFFYYS